MSLTLSAASVTSLTRLIRNRIREGAPVVEVPVSETPAWLAVAVEGQPVEAVFQSKHAAVAVLAAGGSVVRKAP